MGVNLNRIGGKGGISSLPHPFSATGGSSAPAFLDERSFVGDGVNRYIDLGNNYPITPTSPFTLIASFKTNYTADEATIIAKADTGGAYTGYFLNIGGPWYGGKIRFGIAGSSNFVMLDAGDGLIYDNVWRHVICTKDTGTAPASMQVYIEGALAPVTVSGTGVTGSIVAATTLSIGSRSGAFHFFKGNLTHVQVLQRWVDAAEANSIYLSRFSQTADSWWPLGEGLDSNTQVFDNVGSIHGTIINGGANPYSMDVP